MFSGVSLSFVLSTLFDFTGFDLTGRAKTEPKHDTHASLLTLLTTATDHPHCEPDEGVQAITTKRIAAMVAPNNA